MNRIGYALKFYLPEPQNIDILVTDGWIAIATYKSSPNSLLISCIFILFLYST